MEVCTVESHQPKPAPERITLVCVKAYLGPVYVDSAWSTAELAARRIADLKASEKAFDVVHSLDLRTLEIRLDVMGVPLRIDVYDPPAPPADKIVEAGPR